MTSNVATAAHAVNAYAFDEVVNRQVSVPFRQVQDCLSLRCETQGLQEITGDVADWLDGQHVGQGMLTVFIRHTSASILIQENFDDDVQRDLETFFLHLVPEETRLYRHIAEGPDDMPAHIKGALTQTHLNIPVTDGRMMLGQFQGIYLFEHRRVTRTRELVLHFIGS